jgi:hypothetical protein
LSSISADKKGKSYLASQKPKKKDLWDFQNMDGGQNKSLHTFEAINNFLLFQRNKLKEKKLFRIFLSLSVVLVLWSNGETERHEE